MSSAPNLHAGLLASCSYFYSARFSHTWVYNPSGPISDAGISKNCNLWARSLLHAWDHSQHCTHIISDFPTTLEGWMVIAIFPYRRGNRSRDGPAFPLRYHSWLSRLKASQVLELWTTGSVLRRHNHGVSSLKASPQCPAPNVSPSWRSLIWNMSHSTLQLNNYTRSSSNCPGCKDSVLIIFKFDFILCVWAFLLACMSMYYLCVWYSWKPEEVVRFHEIYQPLGGCRGIELESSERVDSALNSRAITPDQGQRS